MTTYKILRFFKDHPTKVIDRGLSLEEAQDHCRDPETSSSTCRLPTSVQRSVVYGAWFDGYEEEKST